VTIPLPPLPRPFNVITFSSDGRAIYVKKAAPFRPSDGIIKIEFKPMHLVTIPGSLGLGDIWYLTDSSMSMKIFVSGSFGGRDPGRCGVFAIDPASGSFRNLRTGSYPDCGGGVGPISPDGLRVLTHRGNELEVLNLESGLTYSIGAGLSMGSWSPDGRWIAAWGGGRLKLIDPESPSRQRKLGASGEGAAKWSPDSKFLLLEKSELRCAPYLYYGSLEAVDVETGKRTIIKSSRCNAGGWVGWIDPEGLD
jgi:hypothetical protein